MTGHQVRSRRRFKEPDWIIATEFELHVSLDSVAGHNIGFNTYNKTPECIFWNKCPCLRIGELVYSVSLHWTFKQKTEKGDNEQSVQPPSRDKVLHTGNETENGTYATEYVP